MAKPVVFVSSTVNCMRETRSLIRRLLKKELGYHVIVSENAGSKPISPVAQCRKWARDCDIFIAILGDTYGSIIKRLGISVSEMEFNEAYKDNPEKILVYVSAGKKETRQNEFVKRVEDFNEGYFRREPFNNETELVGGIRCDLAEFMKDRLDVIRKQNIKVRQRTTPIQLDYITSHLSERVKRMYADAKDVLEGSGFSYAQEFDILNRLQGILMYKRNISKIDVLFSVWILPKNLDSNYLMSYTSAYQQYVRYNDLYKKHPNRFTIHLVQGNGTVRTLENHFYHFEATCFKAEPGLYCGAGFDKAKSRQSSVFFENMLFLLNIQNKQSMVSKLSDAINWLEEERDSDPTPSYRPL